MKRFLLAAAAVAMSTTQVLAANPAAKLSVAPAAARAGAPKGDAKLFGGDMLVTLLVAAAVIAGVILISNGDSDSP